METVAPEPREVLHAKVDTIEPAMASRLLHLAEMLCTQDVPSEDDADSEEPPPAEGSVKTERIDLMNVTSDQVVVRREALVLLQAVAALVGIDVDDADEATKLRLCVIGEMMESLVPGGDPTPPGGLLAQLGKAVEADPISTPLQHVLHRFGVATATAEATASDGLTGSAKVWQRKEVDPLVEFTHDSDNLGWHARGADVRYANSITHGAPSAPRCATPRIGQK